MSFPVFSDFVYLVGWTIFHSLWQGVVIFALTSCGCYFLKNKSPQTRYLFLYAALLFQSFFSLITFEVLQKTPPGTPSLIQIPAEWVYGTGVAWIFGIMTVLISHGGSFLAAQQLKRSATSALEGWWIKSLNHLQERMRIAASVKILQSTLIDSPMVIGFFRPVILIPADLLRKLTPSEWESILVHELAHIRRHDYLANLIQTVLETLFFYHPVVWLLASRIRMERECCCDDAVIEVIPDRRIYVKALAQIAEYQILPLVMAANGNSLKKRIERLIFPPGESPSLRFLRKKILLMGFLLFTSISLYGTGTVAGEPLHSGGVWDPDFFKVSWIHSPIALGAIPEFSLGVPVFCFLILLGLFFKIDFLAGRSEGVAKAFPRSKSMGVTLLIVITLWTEQILWTTNLGSYQSFRFPFMGIVLFTSIWCMKNMKDFLAVRCFGAFSLLVGNLILNAVFLNDHPAKILFVVTAYGIILLGLWLIGSPFWMRDFLFWSTATRPRWKGVVRSLILMLMVLDVVGYFVFK